MSAMVKRAHFKVSFDWPEGADAEDIKDYVETALSAWRGSLAPPGGGYTGDQADEFGDGDPMWGLNPDTLKIVATKQ